MATFSLQRTITSLALATLLILGAWFMTREKLPEEKASNVLGTDQIFTETDTDNDGLKDWEERLWKTDLNVADTDGDGTADGEEIKLKRDPAVKGPGDSMDAVLLSRNEAVRGFIQDENLNLSSSFGRSILSTYLQTRSGESSTGQVEAMQILLAEKLPTAKDYILSDLSISSAKSAETFQVYGNNLASALRVGGTESESELTIFARALDKQDKEELKKLDPIILVLSQKIEAVKKTTVPFTAAEAHLSLLNSLEAAKYDIAGMRVVFDDPVLSFLALNSYKKTSDRVLSDIASIKTIIKNSGAVFVEGQPGYQIFK